MDDPFKDKRFQHLASNPRFRRVPRSERKVKIDHRFKAMFTDDKFKLKYAVDKRGRPVSQSQADNLKKYYDLSSDEDDSDDDGDEEVDEDKSDHSEEEESQGEHAEAPVTGRKSVEKKQKVVDKGIVDQEDEKSEAKRKQKKLVEDDIEPEEESDEGGSDENADGKEEESEGLEDDEIHKVTTADKESSSHELSDDSDQPQTSEAHLKKDDIKIRSKLVDQAHRERMKETISERLKDMTVDYARGIAVLGSDESSSDESTSEDSEDESLVHPWGELDKDAEQTDEATSRFAACHLDWDRITAKDLFILFASFCPPEGFIKSVVIYPSEFGLERMKEEELKGPKELVDEPKLREFDEEEFENKHADGAQFAMEKLREYQLNRLKYYYAVVSFDCAESANKVYTECDGMEYETSATKLDLRFIPEDMEFDQEPKDSCDSLPDITKYKPRLFVNTALQQGKVSLTWDETHPDRVEFTRKLVAGGNADDDEVRVFVAAPSESSGDEQDSDSGEDASTNEDKKPLADKNEDPIAKYKALLASVVNDTKKSKSDVDMEVSWGVGLGDEDSGSDIGPASDSDEDAKNKEKESKNGKLNNRGKKGLKTKMKDGDNEENAELQLLLAEDAAEEDTKSHFNFKDIQKEEKRKNKKRKYQKSKKDVAEDDFEIDVSDSRFSALYTSHHFNIDPADPRFVKTKAAQKIIEEKQKRRRLNDGEVPDVNPTSNKLNPELASLVKSIKGKRSGT